MRGRGQRCRVEGPGYWGFYRVNTELLCIASFRHPSLLCVQAKGPKASSFFEVGNIRQCRYEVKASWQSSGQRRPSLACADAGFV